jgi:hypothetical protein
LLALILLLEGGLGLIAGIGIVLSATPTISRIGQELFDTAAWSRESEKHAEKTGWKWLLTAIILVLVGFIVSEL